MNQPNQRDEKDKSVGTEGGYERPALTPIGNLHDLLATDTGSQCDGGGQPTSGTDPQLC